jgi:glucose-6-phosphate dehydrogenase assembly protein OpcA
MIQAPVTRQVAHEVPLGQIEAELTRLWREADAATLASGGQVIARNSVMTLVVITQGLEQARAAARVIEGLTGQHPSRSLILALQPNDSITTPAVSAQVSIHTHVPYHGIGQVRAEQVMLQVRGAATQHLASIVLPLLLPEMPTFVWWTGDLPSNDVLLSLSDVSDRSFIDSGDFKDPERTLARLIDFIDVEKNPHVARVAYSDFNWTRIKPWRELTAQFFDSPSTLPYLNGVERIEIEYAVGSDTKPNPIQAYLFAGWLASRLKWQSYTSVHPVPGASRVGLHTNTGSPLFLEITPRQGIPTRDWWATSSVEWPVDNEEDGLYKDQNNTGFQPESKTPIVSVGALMRVHIQARLDGKSATFSIVRDDDLKTVTTVVVAEGESVPQRRTPLDTLGETAILHFQLGVFDRNHVYESAMKAIKPMLALDGARTGRTR